MTRDEFVDRIEHFAQSRAPKHVSEAQAMAAEMWTDLTLPAGIIALAERSVRGVLLETWAQPSQSASG